MASAAHSQVMNQLAVSQSQPINFGPQMMTQPPPPMMLNRSYKPWQSQDPNQNPNLNKKFSSFNHNNNWKRKKVSFSKDSWKLENKTLAMGSVSAIFSVLSSSAEMSGGIASLVSPCPVTPAVLFTPIFSPSMEVLGYMAKEEWGVDGYGLMKELIQLRPPKAGQ
ncbi:hypothetical protein E1A91_D01G082100v1 [Gossypium mustelinum]|uniref:Uncharacterized protein n=1 Tax=Gossypium mustelinum TaxID=34275 RepID=A0A5D2W4N0_GOSMU|nr:hypothetical protein E1A91_D01G082100v1 [Gossypium mustelinum]